MENSDSLQQSSVFSRQPFEIFPITESFPSNIILNMLNCLLTKIMKSNDLKIMVICIVGSTKQEFIWICEHNNGLIVKLVLTLLKTLKLLYWNL